MQHSSEANVRARNDARAGRKDIRFFGMCDRMLVGVMMASIVRASDVAPAEPKLAPPSAFTLPLPSSYQFGDLAGFKPLPGADFRPRGRSILEKESRPGAAKDTPMLRGTNVWQRMGDFRSRDRVRVVTLWETGGSSVSLQAGRKGNPSLQWTSRLMNRGGATRGLLDQAFSTSIAGVARSLHLTPHPGAADPSGKPSKSEAVLGGAVR